MLQMTFILVFPEHEELDFNQIDRKTEDVEDCDFCEEPVIREQKPERCK